MVFCPFSPTNEPVAPVVVNISAVNGLMSLCHEFVVAVAVRVPLKLNVPERAEADKVVSNPGTITPRNNNPILLINASKFLSNNTFLAGSFQRTAPPIYP